MTQSMTSTDLAHALGVPMDTPGCWKWICPDCPTDPIFVICHECGADSERICLWPMPDSGRPGAELWTYWLMRALGWPKIIEQSGRNGYWVQDFPTKAVTPVAALYGAYRTEWAQQE